MKFRTELIKRGAISMIVTSLPKRRNRLTRHREARDAAAEGRFEGI